jgi:DNA-binding winged helix-turn-helix (wHTH) protein/TolB-like protein/tetratricopeptide (TPR) repeat protein
MDEPEPHIYEFEDFRLNAADRVLLRNGEVLPLTPKVFDTLLYLVRNHGKVLGKDDLISAIWPDSFVTENNLSQNISTLRQLLGERRGVNHYIVTVPGRGYRFAIDVRTVTDAGSGPEAKKGPSSDADTENPNIGTSNELGLHPVKRKRTVPVSLLVVVLIAVCLSVATFYLLPRTTSTSAKQVRKIAVLPFKTLSVENGDPAILRGMAETLITQLCNSRKVIVVPLTSALRYGGPEQDPQAAGRALGVEYVLDSTMQSSGDRIRLTARLIRVEDGVTVGIGPFDEKSTDVFNVQDAMAIRVVDALGVSLNSEERTALTKRYTENPEAFKLYLQGRHCFHKLITPEVRKSIQFFQQSIDLDPTFALAYAGMAEAYHSLPINSDVPPRDAFPQSKAAAARALEIDESLAKVHASLSMIKCWYDWDWTGAELEAKRAIALNPNLAEAHRAYALLLSTLGRHQEAIAEGARARDLDALSPIICTLESLFLYFDGRNDEAREKLTKTLETAPNFWIALLTLARVDIRQGKYADAIAELTKARNTSGDNTQTISMIGYARALAGQRAEARAALDELTSLSKQRYVPPYTIAMVYNGLGEYDEALLWLEHAYDARDVLLAPFIKADPSWDRLRANPRFVAILKRMNLE